MSRSERLFSLSYGQIASKIRDRFSLPRFMRDVAQQGLGSSSAGNRLTLTDGDAFFQGFFGTIRKARLSINLETYMFNSDEWGGRRRACWLKRPGRGSG